MNNYYPCSLRITADCHHWVRDLHGIHPNRASGAVQRVSYLGWCDRLSHDRTDSDPGTNTAQVLHTLRLLTDFRWY